MTVSKKFTLPKKERLSLKRYIDLLFNEGKSFIAYPFRVIYIETEAPIASVSILISVSKKKFKHAVKRNFIKRQTRESYRLHKQEFINTSIKNDKKLLLAFLYLDNKIYTTLEIEKAIQKSARLLAEKI